MANVFIKSFGCSLNHADSEAMTGILEQAGHKIVDDEQKADAVVINSCIVKGHSQTQLFTYIGDMKKLQKKIIVAGCGAQGLHERLSDYPLIGVRQIDKIADAVEAAILGNKFSCIESEKKKRLSLPKKRKNKAIEIVPISNGCLGSCSFCIVKSVRGNLESYPPEEIISAVRTAVERGVREVWLTAPDTACYGIDIKSSLPELLQYLCRIKEDSQDNVVSQPQVSLSQNRLSSRAEGEGTLNDFDFRMRLGMGNPDWFIKYIDDLPQIFSDNHMFRFLHIPVQSGSDKILKSMRRNHTARDYVKIVDVMREAIPDITISTDIIVGFPGETEEDFQKTVELLDRTRPDVLNLSRFTPRPNTPAESLPNQLKGDVKKQRSRIISRIHERITKEQNNKWIGWIGKIIIDEQGKHDTMIGRNPSYKPVVVQGKFSLGEIVEVEITEARSRFLKARVIDR